MCQWTDQTYESCTDSKDAVAKIKNLVKLYATYINGVFDRSLTGVRIKPTFSFGGKTGYDEGALNDDPTDALHALTSNEVNDIHSLRNENAADLVIGIVFGTIPGVYGFAWRPFKFPHRNRGFSATLGCGMGCNSLVSVMYVMYILSFPRINCFRYNLSVYHIPCTK